MKIGFSDVVAALAHVDDADAADRAKHDLAMRLALDMCRPPNWHGTGMGHPLLEVAREEGVALAWVPRAEIIRELGSATSKTDRQSVLMQRRDDILDDCEEVLGQCTDPWLGDDAVLAHRALEAVRAGHHEAGMALAVSLGEPLAAWASTPRVRSFDSPAARDAWERERKKKGKYRWADIEIAAAGVNVSAYDFKYQVLIAPIPRFFTPWFRESGDPVPDVLSRHVVAHQPTTDHLSTRNALMAVMLVTSIIREMQEWAAEVRATDEETG